MKSDPSLPQHSILSRIRNAPTFESPRIIQAPLTEKEWFRSFTNLKRNDSYRGSIGSALKRLLKSTSSWTRGQREGAEKLLGLKGARPDNAANQRAVSIRATKHRRSIRVNLRSSVIKRFRCTFVYLSVWSAFSLSSPVARRGRRGRLNPPPPPPPR